MAGGETSATKLKLAERRLLVLTLRKGGMAIREIAAEIERRYPAMKVAPTTVHDDLTKMLGEVAAEMSAQSKQVLALELMRLDQMMFSHWLAAVGGTVPVKGEDGAVAEQMVVPGIESAKLILKIMERRAKMLGLDKIDLRVGDPDGNPIYATGMGTVSDEALTQTIQNLIAAAGASAATVLAGALGSGAAVHGN